jgi:hypothetical protein
MLLATPPWFKPPRPKRFEADLTPLGGVADVQTAVPKGAVTVTVNGVNYREFGGVWYQPFYSGSEVIYQTVPNPTG